jgi:uncharacterized protein (DUF1330 family)
VAVYIVFIREKVRDRSEMDAYIPKFRASIEGHPVTTLARFGRQEVLEGPDVEGVGILSFPSFEAAKAWYDSSAYREARQHRFKGADYSAILVEGV